MHPWMAVIRQTRALSAGPWRGGRSFPSGIQVELTSRRVVAAFLLTPLFPSCSSRPVRHPASG
jgi:hypothetical protein